MSEATPSLRPPKNLYAWNGELTAPPFESTTDGPLVYTGERVSTPVVIKRQLTCETDGAAVDHSIALTGLLARNRGLYGEHEHILRMLTCQGGREGDDAGFLYVVLELADYSLEDLIRWSHVVLTSRRRSAAGGGGAAPDHDPGTGGSATPPAFVPWVQPLVLRPPPPRAVPPPPTVEVPVDLWDERAFTEPHFISIAYQLTRAVAFLHQLTPPWSTSVGVFHGNLKPRNVLFQGDLLKVAEIGVPGSDPEWSLPTTADPFANDLFGLGLLLYFVFTQGDHPFGRKAVRQENIARKRKPSLGRLKHHPEAQDLVGRLLGGSITAAAAMDHILFWPTTRKFRLLVAVSEGLLVREHLVAEDSVPLATALHTAIEARLGASRWAHTFLPPPSMDAWEGSKLWHFKTPAEFEEPYPEEFKHYSLVRFVRNLVVHCPEHVRSGMFASVSNVHAYVLGLYPWLPVEVWGADQTANAGHFSQLSHEDVPGGRRASVGSVDSAGASGSRSPKPATRRLRSPRRRPRSPGAWRRSRSPSEPRSRKGKRGGGKSSQRKGRK